MVSNMERSVQAHHERREKVSSSSNRKWRQKYKRLERTVKQQVFINAALYDEITRMEQQFTQSKLERKMLLKKLFQYLPMTESQVLQSTHALKALESTFPGKIPPSILSPVTNSKDPLGLPSIKKKRKRAPRSSSAMQSKPESNQSPAQCDDGAASVPEKKDSEKEDEKIDFCVKPKRKKPGTVPKKVMALHMDSKGVPVFPIALGTLTVYDLGSILAEKPGFHSERYIWPVGFCSTRVYPSMKDPKRRIQYFCYIKDGGADPLFEIVAEDEPENRITAVTATACHCVVLKRLNKARGKDATNTGSGPEFFGFSHPTIQYLIQCLPGADACGKYVRTVFEIPGYSEDNPPNVIREDNLPAMHFYDRSKLDLPRPATKLTISF